MDKHSARRGLIGLGLAAAIGVAVAAHPLPDGQIAATTTNGPEVVSVESSPLDSAWEWLDRTHETGEAWREAGEKREHALEQSDVLTEADHYHHETRTEQTPDAAKGEWDI